HLHDAEWRSEHVPDLELDYGGFFRDDGAMLLYATWNEVEQLKDALSTILPCMSFTNEAKFAGLTMDYLDTSWWVTKKGIITSSYAKPTDDRVYVEKQSMHYGPHVDKIPTGVFMRMRTINHDYFVLTKAYEKAAYLKRSGVDPKNVDKELYRYCREKTQDELLMTFNPAARYVGEDDEGWRSASKTQRKKHWRKKKRPRARQQHERNLRIGFPEFRAINNDELQRGVTEAMREEFPHLVKEEKDSDDEEKEEDKVLRFIVKHHQNMPQLKKIMQRKWDRAAAQSNKLRQQLPFETYQHVRKRGGLKLVNRVAPHNFRYDVELEEKHEAANRSGLMAHLGQPTQLELQTEMARWPGARKIEGRTDEFNVGTGIVRTKQSQKLRNGWYCCSKLAADEVTRKRQGKCSCVDNEEICRKRRQFKTVTGEKVRIGCLVSCFSPNVVYIMTCKCCGRQYVGKTWEGDGESKGRSIKGCRCRMGSHRREGKKGRKDLAAHGYYDPTTGRAIRDLRKRRAIRMKVQTDWNKPDEAILNDIVYEKWTGDVDHMTGADGTSCYIKAGAENPVQIFDVFAIDGVDERKYPRPHSIQYALAEMERYWQARCCTMDRGLNGHKDWAFTGPFSRDTSKALKKQYKLQFKDGVLLTYNWVTPYTQEAQDRLDEMEREADSYTLEQLPLTRLAKAEACPEEWHKCDKGHTLAHADIAQLADASRTQRLFMLKSKNYKYYTAAALGKATIDCRGCGKTFDINEPLYHCSRPHCHYDICRRCYDNENRPDEMWKAEHNQRWRSGGIYIPDADETSEYESYTSDVSLFDADAGDAQQRSYSFGFEINELVDGHARPLLCQINTGTGSNHAATTPPTPPSSSGSTTPDYHMLDPDADPYAGLGRVAALRELFEPSRLTTDIRNMMAGRDTDEQIDAASDGQSTVDLLVDGMDTEDNTASNDEAQNEEDIMGADEDINEAASDGQNTAELLSDIIGATDSAEPADDTRNEEDRQLADADQKQPDSTPTFRILGGMDRLDEQYDYYQICPRLETNNDRRALAGNIFERQQSVWNATQTGFAGLARKQRERATAQWGSPVRRDEGWIYRDPATTMDARTPTGCPKAPRYRRRRSADAADNNDTTTTTERAIAANCDTSITEQRSILASMDFVDVSSIRLRGARDALRATMALDNVLVGAHCRGSSAPTVTSTIYKFLGLETEEQLETRLQQEQLDADADIQATIEESLATAAALALRTQARRRALHRAIAHTGHVAHGHIDMLVREIDAFACDEDEQVAPAQHSNKNRATKEDEEKQEAEAQWHLNAYNETHPLPTHAERRRRNERHGHDASQKAKPTPGELSWDMCKVHCPLAWVNKTRTARKLPLLTCSCETPEKDADNDQRDETYSGAAAERRADDAQRAMIAAIAKAHADAGTAAAETGQRHKCDAEATDTGRDVHDDKDGSEDKDRHGTG
ncbi:MAG: hypothetical protein HRU13_07715, partial [Phycisphaerales bacterium]|nr:hypothetical protein [Phycisphaerales bacterium]